MKLKALLRTRVWISSILALVFVLSPALPGIAADKSSASDVNTKVAGAGNEVNVSQSSEPYYSDVLERWKQQGFVSTHTGKITIPGSRTAGKSVDASTSVGSYNGKNDVLIWGAVKDEWIEYELDVTQGGLYNIELSYHPFIDSKNRKPVALNLSMDGTNAFVESKSIELYRHWKDKYPIRKDDKGDEVRPMSEDISGWLSWELRDMSGSYIDPLLWYLSPGKHKVRLAGSDPMAIESITFKAPTVTEDYKTVRSQQPSKVPPVQAEPITIEAERVQWKNSSSIQLAYDTDIASVPYELGKITFNTLDGERWASGNQEVSWSFEAPENGYYKIAMRSQQAFTSNRSSFRSIMINGKIPFSELKQYRFLYATGWKGIALSDDQNKPYEFYLQKGTNTISMRVTQAPMQPISLELGNIVNDFFKLSGELKTMTGGVDDSNRTWDLKRDLPGFIDYLSAVKDKMNAIRQQLEQINKRPDAVSQGMVTIGKDIESLLKNPNEIPYQAGRLVTIQGKVAELNKQLSFQPLQLDQIYVVPIEKAFPKMEATLFESVKGSIVTFFNSFKSKGKLSQMDDQVLNVWMLRGRDYVNLLQGLSDEMFTTQTGIKVKVNLLPDDKLLLLMNAAGISPDVALGLPQDLPFDYAIRNGMYNLKEFPDFDTLFKRFSPGSMTPFYFDGGYYGVPETQSAQIMYYRKDIMQNLGLQVPNTWDDLYKILPVLQQNGMNFSTMEHNAFFQQNGADYITKDGSRTGLNSDKGFDAFKKWTDLQNKYAVDQRVDSFFQRFRTGSIPIGVADLNTYLQLTVAAPELNGWWGVAPIPGVKQEDGTVARWLGGLGSGMQSAAILKNSKKTKESWEFVKWWTSAEAQERFGNDLETLNGVQFRWYTSNLDAFMKLPWKADDTKAILEQWRWYREVPNVPGSYMMDREILNAWNRTVVDGINYRSSLETAVKEIDREITRKMQEFHYVDGNGNVVHSLNLPTINKPWEGVDKYVK
ncbi:extracellular solute-binding protein [Paenibacillus sp. LMG 31456]|uniref:Extracellular solute-binding protein n=1 Tax=Paenibacillus foliorum TaxID=2654974 RepID=A0A972H5P8_9BACL|nr:extracellular solute-binding protein [Paenibacillus foliorum]NOU96841.1 extracellular solute-binding protein [Paenibacillus foliorum]